jgi:hypothetical protein
VICPRKKKSHLSLILMLSFSALMVSLFAELTMANPFRRESISPPSDVKQPIISFNPRIGKTIYTKNEISLTLNVSIPKTEAINKYTLSINSIRFQRDWNDSIGSVYGWDGSGPLITDFSGNLTLTDIPDGSHSVTFTENMHGSYPEGVNVYYFDLASYSTIHFSVDTTSPSISVLPIKNVTCKTPDVSLNFTVNEVVAEFSYSLDGQNNVTVTGNTTLSGLPVGEHNVTVYAWDVAGNVGASETMPFTIFEPEPFVVAPVVAASIAVVASVSAGILVYFKKLKH